MEEVPLDSPATPRMAPAVLFQPPTPVPEEKPAEASPRRSATSSGSARTGEQPADTPPAAPASDDTRTSASHETSAAPPDSPAADTSSEAATRAKRTRAKKATTSGAKKATTSSARTRAGKRTASATTTTAASAEAGTTTTADTARRTRATATGTSPSARKTTSRRRATSPAPRAVPAPLPRLLDHAAYAPELLALAAVRTLGPLAEAWAEQIRAAYPEATPDGLARLATQRVLRLSRAGGALAAVTGPLAPLAGLAAAAWTQAALVLHLAAAYGHDPRHPNRAVELLVLTQVHPDEESARTALDAAVRAPRPGDRSLATAVGRVWRLATPFVGPTRGWLVSRLARRVVPGAAAVLAAASTHAAAERVAARAIARYRGAA
ncbi:MAG TPA: hypothetical protein VIL44_11885 [Micromonospora sp.]